ncbi:MAG: diaminopimelate epimerase, partial [Burkholderiales bacterium]
MKFTKMEGAGNDFVVLDLTQEAFSLAPEKIRKLADRHYGVGADQVLVVEKASLPGVDFRYRIFNADGGEVEQCGNGARCFVKFVRARGLTQKREIRVETLGGIIAPRLEDDGEVSVDMGPPAVELPLLQKLSIGSELVELTILSMGNPHAVQIVADVERAPVTTQGPLLERHERFPKRVNAGYLQVRDRQRARLRVWERGAGLTRACGTGACA